MLATAKHYNERSKSAFINDGNRYLATRTLTSRKAGTLLFHGGTDSR